MIGSLQERAPDFDLLVIDDGSTDDTARIAMGHGAGVIRRPFNIGIGGAVQAGFQYALESGYMYAAQVDGDGQHEPGQLATLVSAMEDSDEPVDMVCGSRFLTGDYEYPAPISRRTGIHIFSFVLSRLVAAPISDPTSGFRLYNRRAIELFARDYPHDYPEVEAVLMLHHHRLRMREVPVHMYVRGGGRSSISTGKSAYYMIKVMLALMVGLARRRPVIEPRQESAVSAEPRLTVDRLQLVAIVAAGMLFLLVLELVRRRRLMERYALMWMPAAVVLIGLAAWHGGLGVISRAIGVIYPPNALFAVALGFILLLLLHFSASVSRLSDQTKVLRVRQLETSAAPGMAGPIDPLSATLCSRSHTTVSR